MQHTIKSRQRKILTISYPAFVRLAIFLFILTLTIPSRAQWEIEDSHTTASLRGIDSVGNSVAWASGTNGTILRTEDGGYVWQLCAIPPGAEKLDFRGIQAFDANTAIVMSSGKGDLSRLYKTTDGCQTWKLIFTNPDKDGFWDALKFDLRPPNRPSQDALHYLVGYLLGDPVDGRFVIYQTRDSGSTWKRWRNDYFERAADSLAHESAFAASNSSLIVPGLNGPLAFVTGGGSGARLLLAQLHSPFDISFYLAFSKLNLIFAKSESSGAFSVASRIPQGGALPDLMIVGGDYTHPDRAAPIACFLPAQTHFFQKRIVLPETPPHGFRSSVAYDAQQKLWITVGPNGTDISRDDGRNWTPLKPTKEDAPDADKDWNALSLPFVVGPNGRIGKLRPNALNP